jgi:hypothetical protein
MEELLLQVTERRQRLQVEAAKWHKFRIKYRTIEALKKRPKIRPGFVNFTFPAIRNMRVGVDIEQLAAVQPMQQQPNAQVMYMDLAR